MRVRDSYVRVHETKVVRVKKKAQSSAQDCDIGHVVAREYSAGVVELHGGPANAAPHIARTARHRLRYGTHACLQPAPNAATVGLRLVLKHSLSGRVRPPFDLTHVSAFTLAGPSVECLSTIIRATVAAFGAG
jgi:hypothetical protein